MTEDQPKLNPRTAFWEWLKNLISLDGKISKHPKAKEPMLPPPVLPLANSDVDHLLGLSPEYGRPTILSSGKGWLVLRNRRSL